LSVVRHAALMLIVLFVSSLLPLAGPRPLSPPTASFTWTPATPQEGVQFQFTDGSTDPENNIVTRVWDFGDGTGITFNALTHPSKSYGKDGTYVVALTVTDASGTTDTVNHTLTVENVAPVPAITSVEPFTLTQDGVTVPIEVSSGTSTAVDFYQYYGASSHMGFESAFQSNMVVYRRTTTGELALIFTHNIDRDSSGQSTGNGGVTLDLGGVPGGAFVDLSDDPSHCWDFPRCQEFSLAYANEGNWRYTDNTDGGVLSGLPIATPWCISVSPVTWLNINSWVYYSNGVDVNLNMSSTADLCYTLQVDVSSPVVAEAQEFSLKGFFDDPAWLDTHTATWDWGDGNVDAASFSPGVGSAHHIIDSATHAYGRAGTYAVRLVVVEDLEPGVDPAVGTGTDLLNVTVTNVLPVANVTAANPNPAQGGEAVIFDGLFDDPSWLDVHTATWDFGDGTTVAGTFSPGVGAAHHVMDAASHIYPAAGNYTATLTVCDDFGGCGSDTVLVEVRNTPPTASAGSDVTEEEGTSILFVGIFTDPDPGDTHTVAWDFGDGSGDAGSLTTSHAYADNGLYSVTLTVCDASVACDTDDLTVSVDNVAPAVSVPPGAVLDLRLDDGTGAVAADASGYGNDGTVSGGAAFAPGVYGTALEFDGSDDGIRVPDDSSLHVVEGITLSFWIKVASYPPNAVRLVQKDFAIGAPSWSQILLYGVPSPGVGVVQFRPVSDGAGLTSARALPLNTWSCVVAIYDVGAGQSQLYVDGAWAGSNVMSGPIPSGSAPLLIGQAGWVSTPFHGLLDDVAVYGRALTRDEAGLRCHRGASVEEGQFLSLPAGFVDPGFDSGPAGTTEDFTATLDWGDGSAEPVLVSEAPGSAATPTTGTLAATHAFADDASLSVAVQICDDDGGCGTAVVAVTVANVAPTVEAGPDRVVDEGTLLDLAVSFQDPGFDNPAAGTVEDFSAFVNWGEGFGVQAPMTVLETPGSAGTATTGSASASHVYADDGAYLVTVTVRDDDGGYGTDVFLVTVRNVAPTVDPAPDLSIAEGGAAVTVALSASDPGFDLPPAGTAEDFTASVDWGDGVLEAVSLMETPGLPGIPTLIAIPPLSHAYGDDGVYVVAITVCDDDGGCGSATLLVRVANLDPSIVSITATGTAAARLRVAGEKWHDVSIELYHGGNLVASGSVLRVPGSPDDQSLDLGTFTFDAFRSLTARVVYTPLDDVINGQVWGADPAWIILTGAAGEIRLHHTFNVRHTDTWVWEPDLHPALAATGLTFTAGTRDAGSDDLQMLWDFDDGTQITTTHYNDGVAPDPLKSPFGVFPFSASSVVTHAYLVAGTYTITLTVRDDDGGSTVLAFTFTV